MTQKDSPSLDSASLDIVHVKPGADAESGAQGKAETPTTDKTNAVGDVEHGGPKGPEPTRYGDWERKGRCVDF